MNDCACGFCEEYKGPETSDPGIELRRDVARLRMENVRLERRAAFYRERWIDATYTRRRDDPHTSFETPMESLVYARSFVRSATATWEATMAKEGVEN